MKANTRRRTFAWAANTSGSAMGSSVVAAWFAHAAFWALLACGLWLGELRLRSAVILLVLWFACYLGLSHFPNGGAFVAPFVAVLDIGLVLAIFKGDIRIS
jgi:hypothetical protein